MKVSGERPRRADARRSVTAILAAAEKTLGDNPDSTMEQIAEAAGVARTTIHRHFATRESLLETMMASALADFRAAVEAARPRTAPPLVALHQVAANVLQVKRNWRFAFHGIPATPESARTQAEMAEDCVALLRRAQLAGLIDAAADLDWVRSVYYALIGQVMEGGPWADADVDKMASLVVDTVLHGAAPR
ncbi:TetR/AcrR family transcriptional regulator [Streptomyces sp. NPDC048479]|uniref:TetR/AcrR family transcriptional regulator n=1 Tax=Streptomyces sp. NPDC048479 TaxID=3154725 RepID=UPI00343B3761